MTLLSRSIESPFCNLQNFTYALFYNRVLSATGTLKKTSEEIFYYIVFLIWCDPPLEVELKATIAINKPNTKFIFPHIFMLILNAIFTFHFFCN